MSLQVKEFTKGPFFQHPLVVFDDKSQEGFFVDLGYDDGEIVEFINQEKLKMVGIYNTHAHIDHIGATKTFQNEFDVPFYMGVNEQMVLDYAPTSAATYNFPFAGAPKVSGELKDGDKFQVGEFFFEVISTPGHTPGGICFFCPTEEILLAGDTLFAGSIGRTDLPGGDHETILKSLEKLKQLPPNTIVYCGHGETTTIGQEVASNPFLR